MSNQVILKFKTKEHADAFALWAENEALLFEDFLISEECNKADSATGQEILDIEVYYGPPHEIKFI